MLKAPKKIFCWVILELAGREWCTPPPPPGGNRHQVRVPPGVGGNRRPLGGDGHGGGGKVFCLTPYPHQTIHPISCISHNFAFRGKSVTLLMVHGTMFRLMFGLIIATQPPRKMRGRMRDRCVLYVVKSAPPSQFAVSARSTLC